LRFAGPAYHYRVDLEPTQHTWLYVLDWPSTWDAPRAALTIDYMLVEPTPVSQPRALVATSYATAEAADPLSEPLRSRDTRLPRDRNPRTLALAHVLRNAHPGDAQYIDAVLEVFRKQPFFYTLTPPRLGADSVDAFLFDTRRGFCGHFASAFAALMRAGGIPARVVTGYQGGTYNRFANYWIVRQSDAHAWDEVWLDGRGWTRVDPTAVIPPERVDHGLNDLVSGNEPVTSRWQQRTPWFTDLRLRLDAVRQLWRERILEYNSTSQEQLLAWLHIPQPDGQKLALLLAASLIGGMLWLTFEVRRDLDPGQADPVLRAYQRLCRRLGGIGLERLPHEGPEAFAARVSRQRPDLGAAVTVLCRTYARLRYGTGATRAAADAFVAAAKRFRPARSRPRIQPRTS
jgi:transglutaminase-like putative cysteine protease